MSINHVYDVIVIGGGPSGMMAAGQAALRGKRVLLIDKNPVLGKKLSITGGGRCNITNAEDDVHELLSHYGDAQVFLYAAFARFGVTDTFTFFESKGLPLVVEERKRVFPKTEKATDVTKCMEMFVRTHGVTVLLDTPVLGFKTSGNTVNGIRTKDGMYTAKSYIVACGGKSRPDTGSTGEGIAWLKTVGHTIHESNPDLVPLVASEAWVKRMQGSKLMNVKMTFSGAQKKIVQKGDVLCTHFGFSGPAILNSAHNVKKLLEKGDVVLSIDLFPVLDEGVLRKNLTALLEAYQNRYIENALKGWIPAGLIPVFMETLKIAAGTVKSHSVSKEIRHELVRQVKDLRATITGTMGYDWAVVSDGGVDLREVDTKTMQSKIHKNLYIVGDALHITRPSGGYSLQLAWTTGFVAGNAV